MHATNCHTPSSSTSTLARGQADGKRSPTETAFRRDEYGGKRTLRMELPPATEGDAAVLWPMD